MLELARGYYEEGYEVVVCFYGYESICEEWDEVLESMQEVEEDEYMYWGGHEVDEVEHRLYLYQGCDD